MSAACRARVEEDAEHGEIVVAAASNLTDAFDELGRRFTTKTGIRIVNSFGATAELAKQIENGAPFDVFAAADSAHVDRLQSEGLIAEGTRALYARGRLVVWLPRGKGDGVKSLEDLSGAQIERIAVAKPDVAPYGAAAVETLRALNIWTTLEPKIVYAQTVAQVKQFAATGNADAAFIPRSLVPQGEGRFIEVESGLHRPIAQAIGVVRASKKQDAARRFLEFVLSAEGQAVLASYGYEKAREALK
jgi:molybdate transport system substrate-binding protein